MEMLLTDKPELYRPWGFRIVEQHYFAGPVPKKVDASPSRHLSIDSDEDVGLLRSMLAERQPVSDRFAVAGHGAEFLLNASFDPSIRLTHLPVDDAVIAWRLEGSTLQLLDIAARIMPSLESAISALDLSCDRIELHFPPDKLGWQAQAMPHNGPCVLMARGDMSALLQGPPFMLSPMADF